MAGNICGLSEPEILALAITLEDEVEADAIRPWCHRSRLSLPEIWIVEDCWTCSSFAITLPSNVDGPFGALELPGFDLTNPRGTPVGDPTSREQQKLS